MLAFHNGLAHSCFTSIALCDKFVLIGYPDTLSAPPFQEGAEHYMAKADEVFQWLIELLENRSKGKNCSTVWSCFRLPCYRPFKSLERH